MALLFTGSRGRGREEEQLRDTPRRREIGGACTQPAEAWMAKGGTVPGNGTAKPLLVVPAPDSPRAENMAKSDVHHCYP